MKNVNYTPFVPSTGIEKHFAWMSQFPHGSANEKALSDAIRDKMQAAGLEVYQDDMYNLLVRKPAAPGCEHKAPVLLQAHLDMVCTKVPGCNHNFETDPLKLVVDEEGWLHAEGTSLGGDDGYGMAYMMDLLLRDDVKTPELECMFTVQEEIGLIGASHFDLTKVRSHRMVSMDCGSETSIAVSSCGGRTVIFSLPMQQTEACGKTYKLTIGKLTGGHSAGVIHLSRANAIKVLGHTLAAMEKTGIALVSAEAGEADNAVPRDATAIIRIPDEKAEAAKQIFEKMRARFIKLHAASDPDMIMTLEETDACDAPAYDLKAAHMLTALHDGVRAMYPIQPEIKALSSNLGVLSTEGGVMKVTSMIRSMNDEWRDLLSEQLFEVGSAFGASWVIESDYPGMDYNPNSRIRAQLVKLLKEMHGTDVSEDFCHGGLEIGYFSRCMEDMDIVTLGCIAEGAHSPNEKMNLPSFNKMYAVLVRLLEELD